MTDWNFHCLNFCIWTVWCSVHISCRHLLPRRCVGGEHWPLTWLLVRWTRALCIHSLQLTHPPTTISITPSSHLSRLATAACASPLTHSLTHSLTQSHTIALHSTSHPLYPRNQSLIHSLTHLLNLTPSPSISPPTHSTRAINHTRSFAHHHHHHHHHHQSPPSTILSLHLQ